MSQSVFRFVAGGVSLAIGSAFAGAPATEVAETVVTATRTPVQAEYQEAFTSVMAENERLKKENEKLDSTCRAYHSRDFSNMSAIQQLEQRCLRYEQQLSAIPAEVVARYSQQQRKAQKEVSERNY